MRLKPFFVRDDTNRSSIDIPLTSVRHLGMFLVKGYRRLPVPAARSSAVDIVFVFVGWGSSLELYKKSFFLVTVYFIQY